MNFGNQENQMTQAREELAKKERAMMDNLLKLRKEQELELAQKRIAIEKEANDRFQKVASILLLLRASPLI